ncbi:hypothetical protein BS78_06G196900 [Paspalum vaginatum]|nr:hypothetical protein BS78_06G196900 [Paspalum vaginatum]
MASGGPARGRLAEERKAWRKNHPPPWVRGEAGDAAGWVRQPHGLEVRHPRQGGHWEGGYFPVTLHFTEDYPSNLPICRFPTGFFHVNVYDCGEVCLSILGDAWKPSITMRQILIGIQDLLDNPNPASPAQDLSYELFAKNMTEYKKRVRQQAKRYPSLV